MSANAPCEVRGYKPPPSIDSVFADYLKPMVLLALNTDLRRGDVFNLKWSDIDFREKQLKLEDATAKSGQTKHPPLNGDALKLLEDSKLQPGGSFVFSGPVTGDKFNGVNRSWEAFRERAGLTDLWLHDLRHTFASTLRYAGSGSLCDQGTPRSLNNPNG